MPTVSIAYTSISVTGHFFERKTSLLSMLFSSYWVATLKLLQQFSLRFKNIIDQPGFCAKDVDSFCDSCKILHEKWAICLTLLHLTNKIMFWSFRLVRLPTRLRKGI